MLTHLLYRGINSRTLLSRGRVGKRERGNSYWKNKFTPKNFLSSHTRDQSVVPATFFSLFSFPYPSLSPSLSLSLSRPWNSIDGCAAWPKSGIKSGRVRVSPGCSQKISWRTRTGMCGEKPSWRENAPKGWRRGLPQREKPLARVCVCVYTYL